MKAIFRQFSTSRKAIRGERRCDIHAPTLAERLGISHHIATKTLKNTTQLASRSITGPFTKRLRTCQSHLRIPQIKDIVYSDTFFTSVTSNPRHDTCAQIFATANGFCEAHPMKTKAGAGDKLNLFIIKYGIPVALHTDGAKEKQSGNRMRSERNSYLLKHQQNHIPRNKIAHNW